MYEGVKTYIYIFIAYISSWGLSSITPQTSCQCPKEGCGKL